MSSTSVSAKTESRSASTKKVKLRKQRSFFCAQKERRASAFCGRAAAKKRPPQEVKGRAQERSVGAGASPAWVACIGLRSAEVREGEVVDEIGTGPAYRFDREELPVAGDCHPVVRIVPIKFTALAVHREHDAEHFAVIDGIAVVSSVDEGDGTRGQDGDAVAVERGMDQVALFHPPELVDGGRPPEFVRKGDLLVRRAASDGGVVVGEDKPDELHGIVQLGVLLKILIETGEGVPRDDFGDIEVVALECERRLIVDDARLFMDVMEAERGALGLARHRKRDAEGDEKVVLFVQRLPLIGRGGVLKIRLVSAEVASGLVVPFAVGIHGEGMFLCVDRADDAFRLLPAVKAEERFLAGDLIADARKGKGAGAADARRREGDGDRADEKAPLDLADGLFFVFFAACFLLFFDAERGERLLFGHGGFEFFRLFGAGGAAFQVPFHELTAVFGERAVHIQGQQVSYQIAFIHGVVPPIVLISSGGRGGM